MPRDNSTAAPSRRHFLQLATGAAAAAALASTPAARAAEGPKADVPVRRLSKHLAVYEGPINVGIVVDGRRALLIDCGDGSIASCLAELGVETVDRIALTHHHRDQACGAAAFVARGARLSAPEAEKKWFDDVAAFWNDPKQRWGVYNFHPHRLMLTESVPIDQTYKDGDEWNWGPAKIRAVATPGHTDGAMSYVVEVDGQKTAFSGDLIYDVGQVWELYSLQKGIQTSDYHGFMGARETLLTSLDRLLNLEPAALVPSHGRLMDDPTAAVEALRKRLDACYDKYVAISALRHYFPKLFTAYEGRADHMPFSQPIDPPDCLHHFGTTWVLVANNGAALMMDCGSPKAIQSVEQLIAKGTVKKVEGLWVTHYHNDHTEAIPEALETFGGPCLAETSVARVIEEPMAWRLPCVSKKTIKVDRVCRDGQSWQWHEWRLTSYFLPGQTLYHGALLADNGALRMLFIGDSFTPAGIDDYCAQNRNWLGAGVGFDYCLDLVKRLRPTHLFNPHVDVAWQFSDEQIAFMRANLAEREKLFGELVPLDHANYGMDEWWVRCHPYEQSLTAGASARLEVVVTNHSSTVQPVRCRAVLPVAWLAAESREAAQRSTDWIEARLPANRETPLLLRFAVPEGTPAGRHVVAIDVEYGGWRLPQFSEAIVVVQPA
jgi:glyoxylase-like metal-dependent hydrolase (beta-lactamase superfamily II)